MSSLCVGVPSAAVEVFGVIERFHYVMEVFVSICPYLPKIFYGAFGLDVERSVCALFWDVGDIVLM